MAVKKTNQVKKIRGIYGNGELYKYEWLQIKDKYKDTEGNKYSKKINRIKSGMTYTRRSTKYAIKAIISYVITGEIYHMNYHYMNKNSTVQGMDTLDFLQIQDTSIIH